MKETWRKFYFVIHYGLCVHRKKRFRADADCSNIRQLLIRITDPVNYWNLILFFLREKHSNTCLACHCTNDFTVESRISLTQYCRVEKERNPSNFCLVNFKWNTAIRSTQKYTHKWYSTRWSYSHDGMERDYDCVCQRSSKTCKTNRILSNDFVQRALEFSIWPIDDWLDSNKTKERTGRKMIVPFSILHWFRLSFPSNIYPSRLAWHKNDLLVVSRARTIKILSIKSNIIPDSSSRVAIKKHLDIGKFVVKTFVELDELFDSSF